MSTLIIYQSTYGNTKRIAEAMAEALGAEARLCSVEDLAAQSFVDVRLIIVGSPTIAWRYAPGFQKVFEVLRQKEVRDIFAAAFDTGFDSWFAGNAAGQIAKKLKQLGCQTLGQPTRFIVLGKEGPLKTGEIERAKVWAQGLLRSIG